MTFEYCSRRVRTPATKVPVFRGTLVWVIKNRRSGKVLGVGIGHEWTSRIFFRNNTRHERTLQTTSHFTQQGPDNASRNTWEEFGVEAKQHHDDQVGSTPSPAPNQGEFGIQQVVVGTERLAS